MDQVVIWLFDRFPIPLNWGSLIPYNASLLLFQIPFVVKGTRAQNRAAKTGTYMVSELKSHPVKRHSTSRHSAFINMYLFGLFFFPKGIKTVTVIC